jgi:hypothetical protein
VPTDPDKAECRRKQVSLLRLVENVKLWPSRRGTSHDIREFEAECPLFSTWRHDACR